MRNQINTMFRRYLNGAGARWKHWEKLLGYSGVALEARLRETIPTGFTWDDFMSGKLHIDHIRPIASFEIASVHDPAFKECWALSNLQFLPEFDNKSKGARLNFQRVPA